MAAMGYKLYVCVIEYLCLHMCVCLHVCVWCVCVCDLELHFTSQYCFVVYQVIGSYKKEEIRIITKTSTRIFTWFMQEAKPTG